MKRILTSAAFFGIMLSALPALAVRDHLQCFKIRDALAKGVYAADLRTDNEVIPPLEPGCTITMPAKLFCIDVAKQNVTPQPPGNYVEIPGQPYLCYRAKCNQIRTELDAKDQFGTHPIAVSSTSLVCAPIQPPLECATGETLCGSGTNAYCADTEVDAENCGACGNACIAGDTCTGGACTSSCATGEVNCNGVCANLATDEANCGACGTACATGTTCTAGICSAVCAAGEVNCNGVCAN